LINAFPCLPYWISTNSHRTTDRYSLPLKLPLLISEVTGNPEMSHAMPQSHKPNVWIVH